MDGGVVIAGEGKGYEYPLGGWGTAVAAAVVPVGFLDGEEL